MGEVRSELARRRDGQRAPPVSRLTRRQVALRDPVPDVAPRQCVPGQRDLAVAAGCGTQPAGGGRWRRPRQQAHFVGCRALGEGVVRRDLERVVVAVGQVAGGHRRVAGDRQGQAGEVGVPGGHVLLVHPERDVRRAGAPAQEGGPVAAHDGERGGCGRSDRGQGAGEVHGQEARPVQPGVAQRDGRVEGVDVVGDHQLAGTGQLRVRAGVVRDRGAADLRCAVEERAPFERARRRGAEVGHDVRVEDGVAVHRHQHVAVTDPVHAEGRPDAAEQPRRIRFAVAPGGARPELPGGSEVSGRHAGDDRRAATAPVDVGVGGCLEQS